ncbi:MAG: hypothetical protein ABWZ74_06705, partial [Hyphomicrobiaceae bacterium]
MRAPRRQFRWVDKLDLDSEAGHGWGLLPVSLVFVLCFCVMTAPWLSGRYTIPWDSKAHFQPQIQFLADCIARGEWPFWNPYVFSGQPQIADPQSMIFSPPFLLLALVNGSPSLWAADVTLLLSMLAGGLALIAWMRDRGWHWAGALLAAIVFSFGAAMAWRIQHFGQVLSLVFLPVTLLCLDRALERGSLRYGLVAGLAAGCIVLGRDQVALLCVYVLIAYVLWRLFADFSEREGMFRRILSLGVAGAAGFALVIIPVLFTVLLAAGSNRPEIDYVGAGRGSLHPALLLTFLVPDVFGASGDMKDYWGPPSFAWKGTDLFIAQNVGQLYMGAIPLLLIVAALFGGRLWDRQIRFFAIAFAVMLIYALGWYTPVFRLMYAVLPGVNLYRRPADAVFLVGALGAILAGYAAHVLFTQPWMQGSRQQLIGTGSVLLLGLLVALVAGLAIGRMPRLWGPLGVAALCFGAGGLALAWAQRQIAIDARAVALVLVALVTADLAWNNGPSTSSALRPRHYDVLQPKTRDDTITYLKTHVVADITRRDRVELAGLGFHWPNASMTHRLENTLGYSPVRLGLYSRATGAEDHVGLPDQRKFSPLMPSYRSLLADMLGLRFIATGVPIDQIDKRLQPGDMPLVARTNHGYIHENTRALPRVLFASAARKADFEALLTSGEWPADFNPETTVLLETPPAVEGQRRTGTSTIRAYGNTEITIDVESPDGGWVVVNDPWHPWWFATMDGREAPLLRANVLFRAVAVPPGRHFVTLRFEALRGTRAALTSRA